MQTTMTGNELASKVLGNELSDACDDIELRYDTNDSETPEISVDTFAEGYLNNELGRALSKKAVEAGSLEIGVEFRGFNVVVKGQGLALLLIILCLIALVVGVNQALELLRELGYALR